MAVSSNFFGLRTGSTKTLTFAIGPGNTQITKDRISMYPTEKTYKQAVSQASLSILASAWTQMKDIQRIMHFEGQKGGESDYNVFIRKNRKRGLMMTPDMRQDENIPKFGNYYISWGKLKTIYYTDPRSSETGRAYITNNRGTPITILPTDMVGTPGGPMTVGTISRCMMRTYKDILEGDTLTFVAFVTDAEVEEERPFIIPGSAPPSFRYEIFAVRPDSEQQLPTSMFANQRGGSMLQFSHPDDDGCAIIHGRSTSEGIKVSKSIINLSPGAELLYQNMRAYQGSKIYATDWTDYCLVDWGYNGKSILQGSLTK